MTHLFLNPESLSYGVKAQFSCGLQSEEMLTSQPSGCPPLLSSNLNYCFCQPPPPCCANVILFMCSDVGNN